MRYLVNDRYDIVDSLRVVARWNALRRGMEYLGVRIEHIWGNRVKP